MEPAVGRQSSRQPPVAVALALAVWVGVGCESRTAPPTSTVVGATPAPVSPVRDSLPVSDPAAPMWDFREVPVSAAGDFAYDNGRSAGLDSLVETIGGGVAVFDYDGDGRSDLFYTGGGSFAGRRVEGRRGLLLRNLGGWAFDAPTEAAGLSDGRLFTHGAVVGDYDADGFPDLLVTGYGGLQLFHNRGDGTFEERAGAAGLVDEAWNTAAAWVDLDGDGALDLYVANYVDWSFETHRRCPGPRPGVSEICGPKLFEAVSDLLFMGDGEGAFRAAPADAGLEPGGKGLGVIAGDVDLDGDCDLYVGNDTTPNFLYLNDGLGRLVEAGQASGVAYDDRGLATGTMGLALCDFNGDLLPDLFAANFEHEAMALYRNEGGHLFLHVSRMTGVADIGGQYVGWGTALADLDHDGDEDLLVATGHLMKHPTAAPLRQLPLALANDGGRFRRAAAPPGEYLSRPHNARGLGCGDLDGDGDLDLAVVHDDGPPVVLENHTARGGSIRIRLVGATSHRDAVGAWAVLHTSDGDRLRLVSGGGSYLSQHAPELHWGLPPGVVAEGLTVRWPSGRTQRTGPLPADDDYVLVEPGPDAGARRPLPLRQAGR